MVFFLSEYLPNELQYKGQYAANEFPNAMVPKKYRDQILKEPGEELGLIFDDTNDRLIYSNGTTCRVGESICQHL
jgi:hypothetical protein